MCGITRVPRLFSCPMDFNLLCDRGRRGGVLSPTKNIQFEVFLEVWTLFPDFFGRLRGGLL